MNHPNSEDLNEDKIIADDTQDHLMQMVVELKLQNEYLKSHFQVLKNVHLDLAGSLQQARATDQNGICEDKDLHEKIESLNRELLIERQTRGAAEVALEHLRADFLEAYAKSQELADKQAEAQKNLEQQIEGCDRCNGSNTTRDQISELPEYIVHHILSYLDSPADLVRCSVLSKKWFTLTASFPVLDFNICKFKEAVQASGIPKDTHEDKKYVRDNFFKYVSSRTSRFCNQNLSAHTFSLKTSLQEPIEKDIIDGCVRLILEKGVQVFGITIWDEDHSLPYVLPDILFASSSLTSLKVHGCFPFWYNEPVVKFKSLKMLHLYDECLDEETIKHLVTSCPLLEEIYLFLSYSCTRLCVNGLHNLHKLEINYEQLEMLDIEAPNLSLLILRQFGISGSGSMNLASCKKLTTVAFAGCWSQGFGDFISNFPFVENLFLKLPSGRKNVEFSSLSLKTFVLYSSHGLECVDIDTPNLLLFEYHNSGIYCTPPLVRNSVPSEALMECYLEGHVDVLLFQNLRQFMEKKKEFRVLKLHISVDSIDFEQLKLIQFPAYQLEHLELKMEISYESWAYEGFVDTVLRCWRPQSLTLILSEFYCSVVKSTYEKLLQQEDQSQTNIRFVASSSSKRQLHFSDWNSCRLNLPFALYTDRTTAYIIDDITFIKEELSQQLPEKNETNKLLMGWRNLVQKFVKI